MAASSTQIEFAADLRHPNWGAIWAGVFTFFAIWSVFGALCLAIFAGSDSVGLAMSVWGIILTIIAMFVAGRATGRLCGVTEAREGVLQGMIMFGLAVTSTLVVVVLGGMAFGGNMAAAGTAGTAHISLLGFFSDFGWAMFVGLFLGWLAAIGGASSAHKELPHAAVQREAHA